MMTIGQLWVTRRLGDIITALENAAGQIDPQYYPNAESFITDVFDETLSKTFDGDATELESDSFNDKYSSVLSALEDIFGEQLKNFYHEEMSSSLNESFDQILDLFNKKRSGEVLKPSEQTMMRAFNDFVNQGGNAEEFIYDEDSDYGIDEREGMRFKYNLKGRPFRFEFSEEIDKGDEIEYYGEVIFNGDEFLGVIVTDKRGYLLDYDFYSTLSDDDVRLKDVLENENSDAEIENFFQEEIIPELKSSKKNIRETINESEVYKNIERLVKYWRKQLKSGKQIRYDDDELEMWGITKIPDKHRTRLLFQELVGDEEFAEKFINKLLNKTFSTKDFSDRIVGGYDFEWVINNVEYRDFDFFLYGKTLPGGSVSMMDGRHLSLQEALEDEDIGWEIQEEVNNVVEDCMITIILPVTGYDVTVPLIYISEE